LSGKAGFEWIGKPEDENQFSTAKVLI
jgi:hypothetical protein